MAGSRNSVSHKCCHHEYISDSSRSVCVNSYYDIMRCLILTAYSICFSHCCWGKSADAATSQSTHDVDGLYIQMVMRVSVLRVSISLIAVTITGQFRYSSFRCSISASLPLGFALPASRHADSIHLTATGLCPWAAWFLNEQNESNFDTLCPS